MDIVPPSYQSATARDAWSIIAHYIPSSDLCSAALVCQKWHGLFMPFLWGDPASHFGTENDAVYVALTRFRRTLKYARLEVRRLTHTLHMPPALSEIYGGPRPEWLREILEFLPCLQSLIVSKLPFFDHNAMMALKRPAKYEPPDTAAFKTYSVRLLMAEREPNATSQGLAEALLRFQELVYLDLSYTTPARDLMVFSSLSQLDRLQVLKLRGIGLRDREAEFLANAIGTRVRFLDLRNNLLSDMAVRSLLQASFVPNGLPTNEVDWRGGSFIFHDRLLRRAGLDSQFVTALTQPLTGRSWVEDLSHVGITHLYIADNQLTVEGVASLLASSRLHVLDVGTVDTVQSLERTRQPTISSPMTEKPARFPGAEKLIPVLGSIAKENLTYLRAHHALCTADTSSNAPDSTRDLLPELPDEASSSLQGRAEMDAANEIHELSAEAQTVFELEATEIAGLSSPAGDIDETRLQSSTHRDDLVPQVRRGSIFAPEVVEPNQRQDSNGNMTADRSETVNYNPFTASIGPAPACLGQSGLYLAAPEPVSRCASPVSPEDLRTQKIQGLLAKRPKNQSLPRRDGRGGSFPYLHPSHVPHLETLVLTDVPSHVPEGSHILPALIRFITACSNEALLATLLAGSDYSLPPGRARAHAEQERSRSLFALRRLVLEITPTTHLAGPARISPWKSISQQNGTLRSSTGDRDSENLWSAATGDFSFFGEDECGIPENDPGKYFPMAILNEKVTLIPEDEDSGRSGSPEADASFASNSFQPAGAYSRRSRSQTGSSISVSGSVADARSSSITVNKGDGGNMPVADTKQVDLVAELAAFRRAKRLEYEEVVRADRERRSMSCAAFSHLSPPAEPIRPVSPSPSVRTMAAVSAPHLSIAQFVEGHWRGEVKIVRNAVPKGRTGVVDMYGNYFEKGYLYP
ncbi:leucine rich repeat protein [Aspergillus fischeri NRRL 181]|uniref:Leucine rich repeat protein n=1 Tax=Neosartorya fischeri (strain ATCC 1020 / DSM 3700 / CBS 544.65 / FGSC A1164 / JCM 1740 / NRRL 181 / WB 181) TaxID=331117 RepID=A1D3U9_NEOFI|nr:leucine rich repeat protein [Aspergillus fischeri NRRL 181]EAW23092.1 leucine rich repeat protein [Aspergillus fischeri NRRL 181]